MHITQETRARIIGAVVAIFTVVFLCLPYAIGGHPGEPATSATADYHLS